MEKRQGKTPVKFDEVDVMILKFVDERVKEDNKPTITDVRNFTGLTHSNLVNHLKKLTKGSDLIPPLIKRERDKQTIFLSFTEIGEKAMEIFREAWRRGIEGKNIEDLKDKAQKLNDTGSTKEKDRG